MEDVVLKVENISKSYGSVPVLENVSFSVKRGEVLGIIGPNGAGKSTLLKILSGNTKPDKGSVYINGKIISILDIGAGFHPDLSGLDNIYLIASLYNLKRENVDTVIDKIIDFSESKEYIDNMVKTYSSGMYLRVAFSLFIHLDFDILILDEILSVGDAKFIKKVKSFFDLLLDTNKTIILATHNTKEVSSFCSRVLYFDKKLKMDTNNINEGLTNYLSDYPGEFKELDQKWSYREKKELVGSISNIEDDFLKKINNEYVIVSNISLSNEKENKKLFLCSEKIVIQINYNKKKDCNKLAIAIKLFDINDNEVLFDSYFMRENYVHKTEIAGDYFVTVEIPPNFLAPGRYFINLLVISDNRYVGSWHGVSSFDVKFDEWMKNNVWSSTSPILFPYLNWTLTYKGN